jgi:hypothetical protein
MPVSLGDRMAVTLDANRLALIAEPAPRPETQGKPVA